MVNMHFTSQYTDYLVNHMFDTLGCFRRTDKWYFIHLARSKENVGKYEIKLLLDVNLLYPYVKLNV